jgi:Na+-translocating ferredoxin:NAD+ oxidoreductase RnfD subunit
MSDATRVAAAPRNVLGRSWERASRLDPRYLIALLITLVLVAAQLRYHMVGGYDRLLLALAVCTATEALLSWFDRGKIVNLLSAYISGISLTLLIKPQGAALWPFALGGFLAISSKYVLRYRDNHLWNPTNFAIVALLLAAPDRVSVLSHQFGNDVATNLVIWAFGLVIAARVGVLHITLTYLASFLLLNSVRAAALGQPLLPELAPITGPMYQLFVFFMITDPRTVVRGRRGQIAVAVVVAAAEALIRFASDRGWPLPIAFNAAPPLVALAIVGPVAKWLDLRSRH